MSSRAPRSNEFEDQDYYPPPPRRGDDARDFRRPARSPPQSRGPPLEREESYVREREYSDVRVRDRSVDRGPPAFLRDDGRRPEHGPMVLRKREVETIDRHDARPRASSSPPPPILRRRMSPSPPPMMRRGRSPSPRPGPPPEVEHLRARFVDTERIRSPSEVRPRRLSSPRGPRFDDRRPRSLSPPEQTRVRTRIIDSRRERDLYSSSSSSSPSPPPAPPVIKGPTIEREVITHYRDIDHGMVQARPPSPRPLSRTRPSEQIRSDETDVDISLGRNRTEVDVVRRTTRSGSRGRTAYYHDDDLGYDRYERNSSSSTHISRPVPPPMDDEAREITSRIDSRGRMGESWGGATRDWTILDVPPGTERVRMDGKGGGSTDTTWTKYSGVRRTKFVPERDGALVPVRPSEPTPLPPATGRDRLSVSVQGRTTDIDIEKTTETRLVAVPPPPPPAIAPTTVSTKRDVWTEITKDLVNREAIETMGYPYEESKWHFCIMQYLHTDQVKELTDLTDQIRRARMRRHKPREIPKAHDDIDVRYHRHRHYYDLPPVPLPRPLPDRHHHHHHHHHGSKSHWDYETETYREREVFWDSKGRKWYR